MSSEPSKRETAEPPARLSRRGFGRAVGGVAVAGTVHALTTPESSAQSGKTEAVPARVSGDLCDLSAVELAARIRRKDVSAREVMTAHLARIERVNPE